MQCQTDCLAFGKRKACDINVPVSNSFLIERHLTLPVLHPAKIHVYTKRQASPGQGVVEKFAGIPGVLPKIPGMLPRILYPNLERMTTQSLQDSDCIPGFLNYSSK